MAEFIINKTKHTIEIEKKYLVEANSEGRQWDKEYLIAQWYFSPAPNETKLKLIIDLKSFAKRWVRVSKQRLSSEESEKTIEYLDPLSIGLNKLLGRSFNLKRRSIMESVHLDRFILSNKRCQYLLENEGTRESLEMICRKMNLQLTEEVSNNEDYKNYHLSIPFRQSYLKTIELLLEVYQ